MTLPVVSESASLRGFIENESRLIGRLTADGILPLNQSYSRGFPLEKDLEWVDFDVVYTIVGSAIAGVVLTEVPEYKRRKNKCR